MNTATSTTWRALQDALSIHEPLCEGDERFTSESGEHDVDLRAICARCPVMRQCADYGRTAPRNSSWGFYGGVVRRTNPQVRARPATDSVRD